MIWFDPFFEATPCYPVLGKKNFKTLRGGNRFIYLLDVHWIRSLLHQACFLPSLAGKVHKAKPFEQKGPGTELSSYSLEGC